ncbi:aspartate carbamoyltransferase catalytic subunit [Thermoactinomyces sp. CICC 10521]|uniref:Aspartate carbamoyltransferase n=2 Tax=Thermoactinomycetaceae TaxID=186824 RepID=A0A7W1X9E0_9BACL|nr:aspartate carbamoyltransferase catalytic subunit [Thermoactinomyces daqus]MBH8598085.1 aspartate carbamoyltransferase catalytic subunit [Thermoactinomyces sp. CICC 10523]MBH8603116.1 aspartate carbamoyltransferase catalytic subunit [Thermoactinomyces sp. CICC 10522]MBH8607077.1 aspartate carbamoyltransferase catalytic subunit [Thermoactinomyces sp. CICC 10521]
MTRSPFRHLMDTSELTKEEIRRILERAHFWEEHQASGLAPFTGRFAANLFFEPSTRTRFSFEVAEKRLGMQVVNFTPDVSSSTKGESLFDTVKTLVSIGVEVAVIRLTDEQELLFLIKQNPGCAIINAGAGSFAHPSQSLLDLYTLVKHFGDLTGKRVAVIGDIAHSRVVRSNLWTLKQFGAEMIVSGPEEMRDPEVERIAPYVSFEEALRTADVVMLLRVQLERHQGKLFSSREEYHRRYGLSAERLKIMKPEAIIMHPAPVNRGVEIADELVEHPRSKIFEQMKNGVWIRMAILERALGEW